MSATLVVARLAERDLFELVEAIAHRRGVTTIELCGRCRTKAVSRARQEAWWLLRHDAERHYSICEIARLFGRDPTTVLAGVAAHAQRMSTAASAGPAPTPRRSNP